MSTQDGITRRGFFERSFVAGGAGLLTPHLLADSAAAEPAAGWTVGIYTRPWDKYDYRVALDAMAEAGFKHAGLMTTSTEERRLVIDASISVEAAEKIGQEVTQRGMEIPSVYGGGFPLNESLEAAVAGLKRLIDNCAAAGAKSLLLGGTGEKLFDRYYETVAKCCDYAAERNLPITIKPHGGLNATGKQCRKCIEKVGHENFSLWYDPGNIFFYSKGEIDPVDDAAEVAGLVKVGMCIKDFDMVRKNGELAPDVWITPGKGRVDFPRVLARLMKGGLRGGALVIETISRGEGALPEILAEVRIAKTYVESVVSGL